MTATVDGLRLRKALGREQWQAPEPFGPDGWRMVSRAGDCSVIVTTAEFEGATWTHASRTAPDRVPTYEEMIELHRAVWGETGYSYQVQAPLAQHVNIHPNALHLWGRADGRAVLPEFASWGTI